MVKKKVRKSTSKKKNVKRKPKTKKKVKRKNASKLKKTPKPKVKKKTKKKKITRRYSKTSKFVKDVSPNKQFVLCNGERLRNIKQLALAVDKLDDGVFQYHVTAWKNDFAKWVYDVFKEAKLAKTIGKIKNKKEMRKTIYNHFGEKY